MRDILGFFFLVMCILCVVGMVMTGNLLLAVPAVFFAILERSLGD